MTEHEYESVDQLRGSGEGGMYSLLRRCMLAVLNDGVLHQCAPPRQLVQHPATAFVGRH